MRSYMAAPMGSRMGSSMALGEFGIVSSTWEAAKTVGEKSVEQTPTIVVQEAPETPWHEVTTELIIGAATGFESVMKGIAAYTAAEQEPYGYMQTALVPTGPSAEEIELQKLKTQEQIARLKAEEAAAAQARAAAAKEDKEEKPWGMYLGISAAGIAAVLAAIVFMRRWR